MTMKKKGSYQSMVLGLIGFVFGFVIVWKVLDLILGGKLAEMILSL